jgi:hypothetical protein
LPGDGDAAVISNTESKMRMDDNRDDLVADEDLPLVAQSREATAEQMLAVLLTAKAEQQQRLERIRIHMAALGADWIVPVPA